MSDHVRNPLHLKTREPLKRIIKKIANAFSNESESEDMFDPLKLNTEQKKAHKNLEQSRKNYQKAQDTYRINYEKAEKKYNEALDKYNKEVTIVENEYNEALAYYNSLFLTTKGGKTRRLKSRGRKTRRRRYL